jgi:4-aminobutyrate aminotransferase-like enzyme
MFGNVFRIAPPLIISQEQLDKGIDIFEEAIKETQAQMH